eukprot:221338-Amphidinium_carterae.1
MDCTSWNEDRKERHKQTLQQHSRTMPQNVMPHFVHALTQQLLVRNTRIAKNTLQRLGCHSLR